jgi:hypothetical protein
LRQIDAIPPGAVHGLTARGAQTRQERFTGFHRLADILKVRAARSVGSRKKRGASRHR